MASNSRNDIGGGRRLTPTQHCPETFSKQQIYNIVVEVIQKLNLNDKLDLQLITENGNVSLQVFYEGEKAGFLLNVQIRECIEKGNNYNAKVVFIEGGLCLLDVERI
jgi:hypothetical protein